MKSQENVREFFLSQWVATLPTEYIFSSVILLYSCSAVSLAEHHLLVTWSTAFYLLERYADEISDQELKANILKVIVCTMYLGRPMAVKLSLGHRVIFN